MQKRKVFTQNGVLVYRTGPGMYEAITRDQMPDSNVPKVILGTAAPTVVPTKVGDMFIDTSNANVYIAQGVSAATDWAIVDTDASSVLSALITTGTAVPSSTPTAVGLIFIDTTADNAYIAVGTSSSADWALIDTDITGVLAAIVSTGAGAPASTPTNIGLIYIDTTADAMYIACDTTASTDWKKLFQEADVVAKMIQTGAGAPASTPNFVGEFYIDSTNNQIYQAIGTSGSSDWKKLQQQGYNREELVATGTVGINTRSLELNHISTIIAATIVDAPANEMMVVKDTSASGTIAHTVALTNGTWDGTNKTATLDAPGEAFLVFFDNAGNGVIVENIGVVTFSA